VGHGTGEALHVFAVEEELFAAEGALVECLLEGDFADGKTAVSDYLRMVKVEDVFAVLRFQFLDEFVKEHG